MEGEQSAGTTVVRGPNSRGTRIAEILDKAGAVHHVGKEKGAIGHVTKTRISSAVGRRPTPLTHSYLATVPGSASRINGLRQQKLWISTAAADGSASDAFEGGGTISSTDWVMGSCRWVFNGGHDGWNEMHATRVVRKIDEVDVPTGLAPGFRTP